VSYAIGANILLYASDQGSPLYEPAQRFLKECAMRQETMCLGWPTLMAYLSISTHPRIFGQPLSPDRALENVETLLGLPQVRVLSEGEDFWLRYRQVTDGLHVRGNLVPDAHLVALLLEHNVRVLYTNDTDFKKFHVIKSVNPFTS
jgi:hypothetical protein